jgi:hypothetical protein
MGREEHVPLADKPSRLSFSRQARRRGAVTSLFDLPSRILEVKHLPENVAFRNHLHVLQM